MANNDISEIPDKKNPVKRTKKSGVSVQQLAMDIGISEDRLLAQFKDADINIANREDLVSEEEKQKLLRYF